jgi:transcriptional regulator of arginine metabolism
MAVEHRLLRIRRLLDTHVVASQDELAALLAEEGVEVTQATVSRDLGRLGAIKIRAGGSVRYAIPEERSADPEAELARVLATRARALTPSGNLLVVHTGAGAAQLVAAAIDALGDPSIVGSVAGDDTIIVVASEDSSGAALQTMFETIGETP